MKTVKQAIKSNPYLKASNLMDQNDIKSAYNDLFELDKIYGNENEELLKVWRQVFKREEEIRK